ncbi:hypothetical protein ABH917_004219 [Thermobifida halotolerans]
MAGFRGGHGSAATPGEVEAFHRTLQKRATTGCRCPVEAPPAPSPGAANPWRPAPDGRGGNAPPLPGVSGKNPRAHRRSEHSHLEEVPVLSGM